MRYLNVILALLMILFAAVQYNDPDGLMWVLIYLTAAVWAILAALRPTILRSRLGAGLLLFCIFLSVIGMVYFWPKMDRWWQKDVFLQEISGETAREGMGMMVVVLVLLTVKFGSRHRK